MPLVIALVVLPTASSSVRICAPSGLTSPDISAMPWALSETGPNVSIATITPTVVSRPQPASATANSAIESEPPAQEERAEDRRADDQRGVDGRLEADREAGEDHGRRAGERGLADVLDRAVVGAGEVAGEREDRGGQHDADDDREAGDQRRVALGRDPTSRSSALSPAPVSSAKSVGR